MSGMSRPDENILSIDSLLLEKIDNLMKGDELINSSEFYDDSIWEQNIEELERDLEEAFKVFDSDGDGFISSQDLECALKKLGYLKNSMDCSKMIEEYDSNLDGHIDFEEFKSMMKLKPYS